MNICKHFGVCGGCQFLDIPYAQQLEQKQKDLQGLLKKFWAGPVPITPAPQTEFYRNKIELCFCRQPVWKEPFNKKFRRDPNEPLEFETALGFKLKGRWDRGFNLQECIIFEPYLPRLLEAVRVWATQNNIEYYDQRNHSGVLRGIMLRHCKNTGEVMLVLYAAAESFDKKSFVSAVEDVLPQADILLAVNASVADAMLIEKPEVLKGRSAVCETIKTDGGQREIKFTLSAQSFFQTNTFAAQNMYQRVRDAVKKLSPHTVYDLYGGAGSFSLVCADAAQKFFCVESAPQAVADGRANAELNGVRNVNFVCAKTEDFLKTQKISAHNSLIILDPPRGGLHIDAEAAVAKSGVKNIIYISCNPLTLARDLEELTKNYAVKNCAAFDFFPHTKHVETMVELELKAG
ncbi:MAG: 23S rRNA (uracil(1939)-C(5))-methyltransferase RlmD [Elusimicrobiota bacterium]|jgi:23S rRNA (uracil1939-C5)-methyltransferase|nr:23S rRNA (uracil(1939)-C(5))-methyltransferase RlmD [Elusimicrobiota bacterium]